MGQSNRETIPRPPIRDTKPKEPPEIEIRLSWCKSCGLCVEYCNRGVLQMEGVYPKVVNAERCNRCLQCENMCPDFALRVLDAKQGPGEEEPT